MWKAHLGKDANLPNFIAALERRGDSADCVERLRKICAKRFEFAIVALILNIIYRVATKQRDFTWWTKIHQMPRC